MTRSVGGMAWSWTSVASAFESVRAVAMRGLFSTTKENSEVNAQGNSSNWLQVKNFELNLLLAEGRRGESIMELKASNADSTAVLGAFVLAFVLQSLSDQVAGIDESNSLQMVSWLCLTLSAASGLSSVLLLTFTSSKLRRLVGRSRFVFGDDATAEELAPFFVGGVASLTEKLQACVYEPRGKQTGSLRCVQFESRLWYNFRGGRKHYSAGLLLLVVELLMYMGSQAACILATRVTSLTMLSVVLLVLPCLVVLAWLSHSGAVHDLA
jgi:hypothetical protein